MAILEQITGPRDLDRLSRGQLTQLAAEIRAFLIREVARTGGHLGPNLGVVELTMAMHRVFQSPKDAFVFDTGHQSYVHKLLTGRQDFSRLRQKGGLAGYPQRAESEHDIVESSHASSSGVTIGLMPTRYGYISFGFLSLCQIRVCSSSTGEVTSATAANCLRPVT